MFNWASIQLSIISNVLFDRTNISFPSIFCQFIWNVTCQDYLYGTFNIYSMLRTEFKNFLFIRMKIPIIIISKIRKSCMNIRNVVRIMYDLTTKRPLMQLLLCSMIHNIFFAKMQIWFCLFSLQNLVVCICYVSILCCRKYLDAEIFTLLQFLFSVLCAL